MAKAYWFAPDAFRSISSERDYDLWKVLAMTDAAGKNFIDLTASIVSAYLSNNPTPASEIPALISQIHAALLRVSTGRVEAPLEPAKPAVSVKKSMTPDYLVCLEDGKRFKSLKRHLRPPYTITPKQYRDKWGLPADYPMVAPNYAVARSQLAKKMGLANSGGGGNSFGRASRMACPAARLASAATGNFQEAAATAALASERIRSA